MLKVFHLDLYFGHNLQLKFENFENLKTKYLNGYIFLNN